MASRQAKQCGMRTRTAVPLAPRNTGAPTAPGRSARYATAADCLLVALIALALRLPCLGCQSLWIDELFSVHWSQLDLPFLLGEGARIETNPPAYYVFLHAWIAAFGSSEVAVRLPSVLASAATVPVVYAIGHHLAG